MDDITPCPPGQRDYIVIIANITVDLVISAICGEFIKLAWPPLQFPHFLPSNT